MARYRRPSLLPQPPPSGAPLPAGVADDLGRLLGEALVNGLASPWA